MACPSPAARRVVARASLVLGLAGLATGPGIAAAQVIGFGLHEGKTLAERTSDLGLVYRNDQNPWIQEFWTLGRYHGQYHWSDGSAGEDEGWEDRRFRLGFQTRLFRNLTVHAQAISGSDFEPRYNGFTELWVGWRFNDAVTLTIGQQKHRFTHDRNVSSRYLQTLERSQLTNMFAADYTPAITLSGRVKGWQYYGGIFSNATSPSVGEAMVELDSGYSLLLTATHDASRFFSTDTAQFNVSLVHSKARATATNLNRFDNGLASALILTDGPGSLVTEVTLGLGAEAGNAYGINLQPGYFLTRRLQAVGRYQLAVSNGDEGLQPQRRYERPAGLPPGDRYQALYAGFNFHVADHRLKLMAGIEYADMGGENVVTGSVAFRTFFGPQSRGPFPMAVILPPPRRIGDVGAGPVPDAARFAAGGPGPVAITDPDL
jgi:phosphate-selective porin OprO/OprP